MAPTCGRGCRSRTAERTAADDADDVQRPARSGRRPREAPAAGPGTAGAAREPAADRPGAGRLKIGSERFGFRAPAAATSRNAPAQKGSQDPVTTMESADVAH